MTSPQILVRVQNATATIFIQGRATFTLGPSLRNFILQCERNRVSHFEIVLDECEYMDSTMLGMLAMLAMGHRSNRWSVELINPPARTRDQLTELGLRPYFPITEHDAPPAKTTMRALAVPHTTDLEDTIREAHVTLGQINPANTARFAGVLEALDNVGLDRNVADRFPEKGLGRTINDRLKRASKKAD